MRTLTLTLAAAGLFVLAVDQLPAAIGKDAPLTSAAPADTIVTISGTVVETLDASGYTYLNIKSNGKSSWAAIPKSPVKAGDQVTLLPGLEARDVESKALGRTFAKVVFSQGIVGADQTAKGRGMMFTPQGDAQPVNITGTVVESMSGGGYTYVAVEKDGSRKWVAIPSGEVKVGQTVSFLPGTVMTNFRSKALNRTFDSIVFSDGIVPAGAAVPAQAPAEAAVSLRTVFHGTQEFSLEEVTGTVAEAVNSGGYTYLSVKKGTQAIWVAIPETQVTVGKPVELQPGEVKRNYVSKKLGKTLPLLMFSRGFVSK